MPLVNQNQIRLTRPELEALLDEHTPRWRAAVHIDAIGERDITVTMPFTADLVRAGGTVSGPALMTLADRAAYYLTLAQVGPVPSVVTANLAIHFLVRPGAGDITAVATMLQLGSRLAVSSVDLRVGEQLVAHATVTYALPPTS